MAEYVCSLIATNAKGLERLSVENEAMPGSNTIKVWLRKYPEFRSQYLKAKELQAHVLMDRTIDVANRDEHEEGDTLLKINRDKLKIDTYKFVSARLNPRDYGDKREVKTEVNLTETIQKIRDANSEYKY